MLERQPEVFTLKKHIFEFAMAIGLTVSLISGALALDTRDQISEKLIRLHIIANSDSPEDQELKLKVRDEVLLQVTELTKTCKDVKDARSVICENLDLLEDTADRVISENGFGYSSRAELSNVYFPTRNYDTFSLPAGDYDALRIHLGNGKGKNWWCVLFPPVCVSAAEAESEFSNAGMTDEEIKFITSDEPQYKLKFKIVELAERFIR